LVELMVVIVIIGVLAAVAIPKMMAATNKAKAGEGPQILRAIANMESAYKAENDEFINAPETEEKNPKTTPADTAWVKLGFDIEPFSKYFTFQVVDASDSAFSAEAALYSTLGEAKGGVQSLEINQRDIRTINGETPTGPLANLLPNWK
ncbi:MAG: hypothetical protein FWF51_12850, partial [Chitinivibrionia bacterium]|nr:hypothetical protein [Chitinivibrionia bacterium]